MDRHTDRQTDLWSCVCFSAYTVVHIDVSVCLSAVHVLDLTAVGLRVYGQKAWLTTLRSCYWG